MNIILRYEIIEGKLSTKPAYEFYYAPTNYTPQTTKKYVELIGTYEELQEEKKLVRRLQYQGQDQITIKHNNKETEKHKKKKEIEKKSENELQKRAILLLAQSKKNEATEEIVNFIKEEEIIITTKSDEKPEMWVYNKGIYEPNAKSLINWYTRAILGEAYTPQISSLITKKIEADTYVEEKSFFNKQNEQPEIIPVMNGLLNIKNKTLTPHSPETPYFNKINAKYDPLADCPVIKNFLKEILPSEEDQAVVQEMIGFCLLREYRYEKAFMLYGPHGRNGKSKLLEMIKRFIGTENISGVSLEDIEKDDFAISNLHNKLVNISGDISNEAIKNTGKFKSLVGRDTLSANRKFKNRIDFVNYAKIIFACNELPPVYTQSSAFWLRWVLIKFPYRFLPEKEMGLDEEYERLQDPDVVEKITTQDELNGLLNYALDGLERLMSRKDFSTTKTAKDIHDDWQRSSNSVAAFCMDCVDEHYDGQIVKQDFLKKYKVYCDQHRIKQMSNKQIKITLKEMFAASEAYVSVMQGLRQTVWEGVKWRS